MSELCIYCGEREATTKDHVPPQCLFPTPRPDNLITVPSCDVCNGTFGKDDERVRNLLTSLDVTEKHPSIVDQIADKRNRAFRRKRGENNFLHILRSLKMVDVYSSGGIFLGRRPAFNLDQDVMNRFIERITRALISHETGVGYVKGKVQWMKVPNEEYSKLIVKQLKEIFGMIGRTKEIGEGIFRYIGFYKESFRTNSLWVTIFYNGVVFMSTFLEEEESLEEKE